MDVIVDVSPCRHSEVDLVGSPSTNVNDSTLILESDRVGGTWLFRFVDLCLPSPRLEFRPVATFIVRLVDMLALSKEWRRRPQGEHKRSLVTRFVNLPDRSKIAEWHLESYLVHLVSGYARAIVDEDLMWELDDDLSSIEVHRE